MPSKRSRCLSCGGLHTIQFVCDPILLKEYGKLAEYVGDRFIRTYYLTDGEAEELQQEIKIALIKLPQKYRNKAGILVILRHRLRDIVRNMMPAGSSGTLLERRKSKEKLVGTFSDGAYDEDESSIMSITISDIASIMNKINRGADPNRDPEIIKALMEQIPASERAVVELTFGLDGKAFSNRQIQKKLNRGKEWVDSRLNKGIERLKGLIEQQSAK